MPGSNWPAARLAVGFGGKRIMPDVRSTPELHTAKTGAAGYDEIVWSAPPISRLVAASDNGVLAIRHLGCDGSGSVQTRSRGNQRPESIILAQRGLGSFEARVNGQFKNTSLTLDTCCYLPHGVDADLEYPTLSKALVLHFPAGFLAEHSEKSVHTRLEPAPAFRNADLAKIMHLVEREMANPSFGQELVLESLYRCTAVLLSRQFGGHAALVPEKIHISPPKMKRIIEYIECNLSNKILIEDLSHIAEISKWHFVRAFKKSMGQTPYQYVMARRFLYAQCLIEKSDKSLSEIALLCGFATPANFSSAFHKELGMTPSSFKKLIRPDCKPR